MKKLLTVFFLALIWLSGCSLEYNEKAKDLERELKISEEEKNREGGNVPVSYIIELSEIKKVMV